MHKQTDRQTMSLTKGIVPISHTHKQSHIPTNTELQYSRTYRMASPKTCAVSGCRSMACWMAVLLSLSLLLWLSAVLLWLSALLVVLVVRFRLTEPAVVVLVCFFFVLLLLDFERWGLEEEEEEEEEATEVDVEEEDAPPRTKRALVAVIVGIIDMVGGWM